MSLLRRRLAIVGLLVALAAATEAAQSTGIRYLYDSLGRLVAVIDANGEAAIYTYDKVGNVLSIARRAAGDVLIVTFSPARGPAGETVRISGIGFSDTPSSNAVSFNGTAATVTSATANEIVVSVPAGATTGAISVVTPTGSSTSASPFVVTATASAPTITGFTPTVANAGAAVTVTGTGFDTVAANDRLAFNGPRTAAVTGATESELDATVPPGATSGRLKVTTPAGTATSAGDFFVPPAPYTPPDVDATARATFGQPQTLSIETPGHIGLLLFDGAPGRRISVVIGGPGPSTTYKQMHPNGSVVQNVSRSAPGFIDVTAVPTAGTYTLMADPNGTAVGNLSLTVHEVPADASATMTIGGPGATVEVTVPGQNARVLFTGTAGQHVGVQASGVTIPSMYWAIRQPNGQSLTPDFEWFTDDDPPAEKFLDVVLPVDGTYAVTFDPDDVGVGAVTVTATEIAADVVASIVPGGPPVTVTTTAAGQNARLTFDGTAGQRVAMLMSGVTMSIFTEVSVLGPTGAVVMPIGQLNSGQDFRDTVTLPATGTYTVFIDPPNGSVGSVTTTLYDVPPDLSGTLTIGGASVPLTFAPAQNGTFTFSGTAGQVVALQMSAVTIAQTAVAIRNPDGSTLGSLTVGTAGGAVVDKTLPVTGTYTVTLDPRRADAGAMTLTLTASGDIVGTITPGGPAVTVTITSPGQNARLLFEGTAGQKVSVRGTGVSVAFTTVSIRNPDGTTLGTTTTFASSGSSNFLDTKTLPATGTYTLFLDPSSSNTGSLTVTLYNVVDVTGPIAMGGGALPVSIGTPGQTARLTFTAPANQRVSLHATSVSGTFGVLAILRPDGSTHVTADILNSSGRFIDATTLPVAGTYTVLVDPSLANVGSLNVALHDATDVSGSIAAGGPAVPVTIGSPGQNSRLTFTGAADQRVSLAATGVTISSSTLAILLPDGTTLASRSVTSSGGLLEPVVLPVPGTYTVLLDPSTTSTGAATLTLYQTTDLTGSIAPGGPAVSLTIGTPGQNARLTFEGAALQRVSLRATSVTIASATLAILRPDGTTLGSATASTSGGFIDAVTLPVAGTYTVLVDPSGTSTGNITLTLYDVVDVTGAIAIGGPAVPVAIATPGQNATLTFEGTAAQTVSVSATAVSISSSTLAILRPDGTTLASRTVSTSGGLLEPVSLPVTGTYAVLLNPSSTSTGNTTLTLHNPTDLTGTITAGGAPVALSLTTPGQNARLTFAGAALQRVSLRATGVTIASATLAILRPDGTTLASVTANTSGGYIDTQTLATAGTYTVLVDPSGTNTGNITLTLYDVVDLTGSIAIDGAAVPVSVATPGQSARLTFDGAAGQSVSLNTTSVTIGGSTTIAVLRPDGTTLTSRTVTTGGGLLEPATLPAAGTYTALVNPSAANTGNATLRLHGITDVTGTIVPGGAAVPIAITAPGQRAVLTFTGTNGQRVSLRAASVTIASSAVSILRPDGTSLGSVTATTSGAFLDTRLLTADGTYTVLVDPANANTGNMTLTLYDVPADVTGTLAVNGGGLAVSVTTPGQNAALTFTATAGQQVTVRVTGNTAGSTTVRLLRPDGTQQTSSTSSASNFNLSQQTLAAGTYTVAIDPAGANTGSLTISVTQP